MTDVATAEIGDNVPPSAAEALRQRLAENFAGLEARRDELLAAFERAPSTVDDEDTARKVSDFIKQLTAAHKNAEKTRIAEKEPHLESGRTVDGYFKTITEPLMKAKRAIEGTLGIYLRKKADAERRERDAAALAAREEAERLATAAALAAKPTDTESFMEVEAADDAADRAEEDARKAAREAAAKPAELSRIRGEYGAVAGLRTGWDFEIENEAAIPLAVLWPFVSADAKEKAIRAFIRAGNRELPGVRIFETAQTVVR